MSENNDNQTIAAIPLPSADLINFRFDQQEKTVQEFKKETGHQFEQLNNKLDFMASTFVTKTEAIEQQTNNDKEFKSLWTAIAAIKAAARWWIATGIAAAAALAGMVYTLTHLHR